MYDINSLPVPVIGAPMAGGPSTPDLVAAVAAAGGLGFLATGYLTPDRVRTDITALRRLTGNTFGLNIFIPEQLTEPPHLNEYRQALQTRADRFGVELPTDIPFTDDHFDAKIDLAITESVPVVSFTFGCPDRRIVDRLHRHDICVIATVTSADEAETAADAGADVLCVQGPDAGGHRATFRIDDIPGSTPLDVLLQRVRAVTSLPLVAAGGIATAERATRLLNLGAAAVQVGTLLLRTPEAGTRPAHRAALADPAFAETVVTRAFSGRPARGLRNSFTDEFSELAPAAYPYVNTLTSALRKAAAADPHTLNLWAGTGYRNATTAPAASVVTDLSRGIAALRDR